MVGALRCIRITPLVARTGNGLRFSHPQAPLSSPLDALVEKKTRFIELLREKRQALITHALTKGFDPNVKIKNSGVEWLGEVPEHWVVSRLCHNID